MSVYKIDKKIKRFEIFQPKTTLVNWYNNQSNKPDILLNASLYSNLSTPCGTIWNDSKLVNNEGNGFGFGTTDGKTVQFGSPWGNTWKDYITGYYGIVQSGKVMSPPWVDKYVFDKALNRIAFGIMRDEKLAIICEDSKTISQFANNAASYGFRHLCNLDGGGSRALLWMGKWIYTSSRTPYNAIAIWLEDDNRIQDQNNVQIKSGELKIVCTKKTQTYNEKGMIEVGRYISPNDMCIIKQNIRSNLLINISYPTSSGMRTAFIKNLENFSEIV